MKKIIIISILLVSNAWAQIPDVPASFPNQSCTPGQLLYRQIGMGRITNIAYHNGHIYTNNVAGNNAREFNFENTSDPGSLELTNETGLPSITSQGNHGHYKIGDIIASHWNPGYQRTGVGVNLPFPPDPVDWVNYLDQPSAPDSGSIRIFYPWSVPFNWLQYGPTPATARLYRAEQLLAEWEPLGDHGIAGNSILLGNLLFITSDATMRGVAVYDISPVFNDPPEDPLLVDRLNGLIGGYLGAIWQDYLLLAGGSDRDIFQVVDISDPTNMRLIKTFDLSGNEELNAGTNVPYVQTQDQYAFTRRHKINMETLELVYEFDEVGNNRPAGSDTNQIDMSQYLLPLGNLLISGGYSFDGRDGIGVWCHDSNPDTTGPYVGYHIPQDGQSNYPLGAPISLVIAEELESFTIVNGESLIVRPVGGDPIDVWHSFSHDGVLTITPKQYFAEDTTYEVILPDGGIKDPAGNGMQGYSFSFSTGSSLDGVNLAPNITSFVNDLGPSQTGQNVTFTVTATDPESDSMDFRFVLGDGTPPTAWSSNTSIQHIFNQQGHFNVKVQVRDNKPNGTQSVVTSTLTQSVISIITEPPPQKSSMMALDSINNSLWVVNPDNSSVSAINTSTNTLTLEVNLNTLLSSSQPLKPVSLALDASQNVWVAIENSNQVIILNSLGQMVQQVDFDYGSRPQSLISNSDGSQMFLTLGHGGTSNANNGSIVKINSSTFLEIQRVEVGPLPRAMALTGDDSRLFVAEFMARKNHAVIWDINVSDMSLNTNIILQRDRGLAGIDSGGSDGPGVPSYISSLVISPDHEWLWYSAIKADTFRGDFFKQGTDLNLSSSHDTTVRSMLGRIELANNPPTEPEFVGFSPPPSRLDVDNADSASSITFSPWGDYAFVTLQGNNTLAAFDDIKIRDSVAQSSVWRISTGFAPQDSLIDSSQQKIWVKNFMSRSLSSYDLEEFFQNGSLQIDTEEISTVTSEQLGTDVLAGKREFYFAGNDPEGQNNMSFEGYISCASCHIDGSHDSRVWDFTQRGEGFRNTTDLRGRRGTGHGNVHWTANFDEIQDFVLDIVNHFGGTGFLQEPQTPNPSLGSSNSSLALELDQLSQYVSSLDATHIPQSPYRNADGSLTASALNGELVFQNSGCQSCHDPDSDYTNSDMGSNPTLHNVGTLRDSSGQRLGQSLTGIDTPTLLGVWETAPYFHDGSAASIEQVFSVTGGAVIQAESGAVTDGASIPNFIEFNYDSSSHGEFVTLPGTLTLSNVDGGTGGLGDLGLRLINGFNTTQTLNFNINGTPYTLDIPPYESRLDWREARLQDVSWLAGANNEIEINFSGGFNEILIDEVIVSTSSERSLAQVHRVALGLDDQDFEDLIQYVLQLDGTDSSFQLSDLIYANGFD